MSAVLGPVAKSRRGSRVEIPAPVRMVRCAIYTRQSVEDRTDNGFTSLDAQFEAGLSFVTTMRSEGWVAVPERYDDGGFTGGNTERPALKRLLQDVVDGKVDTVIVYKIDRLSRSLLDFLRLIEFFEQYQVAFVAVTQQINTATSAGKLMLHILASFASYERSLISERTSDKMCAARRKGKWCGGPPILGYDIDREKKRLVVNKDEAAQVREIFDLYLQHRGMVPVCQELNRRGWTTKTTIYKKGTRKDGVPWNKSRLHDILTNVTYTGQVAHKGQIYKGEQDAIIDKATFRRVQALLKENQNGKASRQTKHQALLKGILKCGHCGSAMVYTYTKKGNRLFAYYVCNRRMKMGRDSCPTPSLPAQEIEDFVVEQIRNLARDPELVRQVFEEASKQQKALIPKLEAERKRLHKDKQAKGEEIRRLVAAMGAATKPSAAVTERLVELEGVAARIEGRVAEINVELAALQANAVDPNDVAQKLTEFDGVWDVLTHAERWRLVNLLVDRVNCFADAEMRVLFRA